MFDNFANSRLAPWHIVCAFLTLSGEDLWRRISRNTPAACFSSFCSLRRRRLERQLWKTDVHREETPAAIVKRGREEMKSFVDSLRD